MGCPQPQRGRRAFVFGRCTYEAFAGHWPNAPEDERTVADPLNKQPK